MFFHSVMNFKRKKIHRKKRNKSRELNSSLKGWSYGRAIAKEVVLRQEFKALKSIVKLIVK